MSDTVSAGELAKKYGLEDASASEPITEYTREVWKRLGFIRELANARGEARYAGSNLGSLWHFLTPILNVLVYFFIFGVLLDASRGVDNYVAYLIVGVLIYMFFQRVLMGGAGCIMRRISLVRALHFPRAVLPLATVMEELLSLAITMGILVVVCLATGEPITIEWLWLIPACLFLVMFSTGAAFAAARFTAQVPDFAQLLPFIMRTWMYASGVMFSIEDVTKDLDPWVRQVMQLNPLAAILDIFRDCLISGHGAFPHAWAISALWSVLALLGGYYYFFKGEKSYGRG